MHNPIIYKKIGINIISPTTSVCDHSSFPKEEIQDRIDFLIPQMEILLFDSFFIRIHFSFERNKLETIFFFGLIPKLTHLPTPLPHTSPHRLTHLHTPPHTSPAPPHTAPPHPHGPPAYFFLRQASARNGALRRADCLSGASFCPLA